MPNDAIEIKADLLDLEKLRDRLGQYKNQAARLGAGVINRELRSHRAKFRLAFREQFTLKAKSINERMQVVVAKPSQGKMEGKIVASEETPPLATSFTGVRETKKGVTGRFERDKARSVINRLAFIIKGNGGQDIAVRRRLVGDELVPRYKLTAIFGPSPVGVLIGRPGELDGMVDGLGDSIQERMGGALQAFLARKQAARGQA